jgi:hypothetical protein
MCCSMCFVCFMKKMNLSHRLHSFITISVLCMWNPYLFYYFPILEEEEEEEEESKQNIHWSIFIRI